MTPEQERSYNPGELEAGMIFDERELIVENDGEVMNTIVCEHGTGDHRREYDIMMFVYDLIPAVDGIVPRHNGRLEIYPEEECYKKYMKQLKQKDLWG